jgi:predicted permease
MKILLQYFIGIFPVLAVSSVFLGNPYLSILLILIAGLVAIPVTFFAIKSLTNGINKRWAVVSLVCSSTAAFLAFIGLLALGGNLFY